MNRFSAREFALLCLPVIFIAGAGLWVATRPKPAEPVPLSVDFRVEKPTTLEAFEGADAVLAAQIRGDGAADVEMDMARTAAFLEVKTAQGTQRASSQSWKTPSVWDKVWTGQHWNQGGLRLPIGVLAIPDGDLAVDIKTQPTLRNPKPGAPAATPMAPLVGRWKIDRSQFAPFDFNAMSRAPQIRVRSAKIISVAGNYVQGEIQFDLLGADMNAQTTTDTDLSGSVKFGNTTYGIDYESNPAVEAKNPLRRAMKWSFHGPATPLPPQTFGDLHGRISANERWPLAFQLDPINISQAKVGQNLKFQQWPAPIPK